MAVRSADGFRTRAFVTTAAALSGLTLPVTGIACHLADEGFSPARHAWVAAHAVLGLLFVVFGIWHVCLNWRGLTRHLRSAVQGRALPGREALCAVSVVLVVLALAVGHTFVLR
jgi:hypothetical protein